MRVEPARLDHRLRILPRVDSRDVDALSAGVQKAQDEVRVVGDANDGGDVKCLSGANAVLDCAFIKGLVL